jgi:glutathione S-transferase
MLSNLQSVEVAVILVGNFLSPYVRRVGVSLNILDLPFELEELFVFKAPDVVRRHNPVVRIPVLVLDDGERLIESGAILDEIDRMVGPDRCLTPASGLGRRRVVQIAAMAIACAEKAQRAFYEGRVRPVEKVRAPWVEHNEKQVLGGFEHLDRIASEANDVAWLAGTPHMSQADVTTVVAFTFANTVRSGPSWDCRNDSLGLLASPRTAKPCRLSRGPLCQPRPTGAGSASTLVSSWKRTHCSRRCSDSGS